MFFSAKLEQEKIDKEDVPATNVIIQEDTQPVQFQEKHINTPKIADRYVLLQELKSLVQNIRQQRKDNVEPTKQIDADDHDIQHDENTVIIGMVGYPNVCKSSVINALCNKKLVGVAARPGKTKHFQTIPLENLKEQKQQKSMIQFQNSMSPNQKNSRPIPELSR